MIDRRASRYIGLVEAEVAAVPTASEISAQAAQTIHSPAIRPDTLGLKREKSIPWAQNIRIGLSAIATAIALSSCGESGQPTTIATTPPRPPGAEVQIPLGIPGFLTINPEMGKVFPSDPSLLLIQTYNNYKNAYGCTVPITVNVGRLGPGDAEEAISGRITLDAEQIVKKEPVNWSTFFQRIFTHSLTHACEDPSRFAPAIDLPDGKDILRVNGLPDPVREGGAEALAFYLIGNTYQTANPKYRNWAQLTVFIEQQFIRDRRRLADLMHTQNYLEIVKAARGVSQLSAKDVKQVTNWYQQATQAPNVDAIWQEILARRGKPLP